jgi:hypothetical protein
MMRKTTTLSLMAKKRIMVFFFVIIGTGNLAQNVPECMYFKFDGTGNQQNYASAPVGNNPATLNGLTVGSTGEFGTALIGNGGVSSSNNLNTGWITNFPSTGWTISFWLNNFPATSSTTYYYFGDATGVTFRCFTGGVAGNGNLMIRGTGLTDVPINNIPSTPTVIHLVYTGTSVKVYFNGVLNSTVTEPSMAMTGTGPFLVGGYGTSNSMSSGVLMDEFRMYNRALTATEIASTWNHQLPLGSAPVVVTTAATAIGSTTATLNGTVNANNASTTVWFDWGLTAAYGTTVAATPATVTGNTDTPVSTNLTGLTNGTSYHYRARGVNSVGTTNGSDMIFTTGCIAAGQAGPITGPGQVCQGQSGYVYSVAPITNASGYVWTLPVGGSIISGANTNSITVSYSPNAVSGNVYVYGTSACGNGAPSQLGVAMNAPATPTLQGSANACLNVVGNVYTTESGMSNYIWTVSAGGSITAGGTTSSNTVTVTWISTGTKTVSVNYNNTYGCPGLVPAVYNVTVNALPVPTISGPTSACTGVPEIYTTQAGMNNYAWTISAGGTITSGSGTSAITVNWTGTGAQSVSVNYTNANGCMATSATNYPVTVNATTVPVITGPNNVCANSGYSTYITQTGMTAYNWAVSSGGTIAYGGGTNTISVTWNIAGTRWVSVNFINPSGCSSLSPTQYNVIVSGTPGAAGTITGSAIVCAGASGMAYYVDPISNAVAYEWTLPAGATISSGANTNTITVDYGVYATRGNITVYGNNICGNGTLSPAFPVTVNPIPPNPVVTNTGSTLHSSSAAGNQWYYEGTLLAGANGQTHVAIQEGYYWTMITLNGCSSDTSNHKLILTTGINQHSSAVINLYPVPNEGMFTVSITTASEESFAIRVYNTLGVKIYEETKIDIKGTLQRVIDLRPVPDGVYTVIFENSQNQVVKKIVVEK